MKKQLREEHDQENTETSGSGGVVRRTVESWGRGPVMPRKPLDKSPTDYAFPKRKGAFPFLALLAGRVRAEPGYGSRDWSLAGS